MLNSTFKRSLTLRRKNNIKLKLSIFAAGDANSYIIYNYRVKADEF